MHCMGWRVGAPYGGAMLLRHMGYGCAVWVRRMWWDALCGVRCGCTVWGAVWVRHMGCHVGVPYGVPCGCAISGVGVPCRCAVWGAM